MMRSDRTESFNISKETNFGLGKYHDGVSHCGRSTNDVGQGATV